MILLRPYLSARLAKVVAPKSIPMKTPCPTKADSTAIWIECMERDMIQRLEELEDNRHVLDSSVNLRDSNHV